MRKLALLIFLLISTTSYSQKMRFEFESIDVRTSVGWNILTVQGEVIFFEDAKTHTISIITASRTNLMYVKSRQLFLKEYNFLYTLIDDYGNESSILIVLENRSWDYIDLYFYSDRPGEKYFRLCLKRCEWEETD
jgi:hypothetical protein